MREREYTWLLFFMLGLAQVIFGLTEANTGEQSQNPGSITLTVMEMPEILQRGEIGTFSVKTESLNVCSAAIGYRDDSGRWTGVNLPELKANEGGICTWTWTAPPQSAVGVAEFRVAAKRQNESKMLIPQIFCIEECLSEEEGDAIKALGINWPSLLLQASSCILPLLFLGLLYSLVITRGKNRRT